MFAWDTDAICSCQGVEGKKCYDCSASHNCTHGNPSAGVKFSLSFMGSCLLLSSFFLFSHPPSFITLSPQKSNTCWFNYCVFPNPQENDGRPLVGSLLILGVSDFFEALFHCFNFSAKLHIGSSECVCLRGKVSDNPSFSWYAAKPLACLQRVLCSTELAVCFH